MLANLFRQICPDVTQMERIGMESTHGTHLQLHDLFVMEAGLITALT